MAKFNFRLATLLKLREAARDERRAQLAQAYQADATLHEELQRLAGMATQVSGLYQASAGPGVIDVDRLLEVQRHGVYLNAQLQYLQKQREAVAAEVERRRAVLAEANRQVKVLENLRDRQLARHREEDNRRQIKQMDESAQIRSLREAPG